MQKHLELQLFCELHRLFLNAWTEPRAAARPFDGEGGRKDV